MENGQSTMSVDSRRLVDSIIDEARSSLSGAGFTTMGKRFPFAMHHEYYRVRLPRNPTGSRPSHADVSRLLISWAEEQESAADYAWQAVAGAVRTLVARAPALAIRIPDDIQQGLDRVESGSKFLEWAEGRIKATQAMASNRTTLREMAETN